MALVVFTSLTKSQRDAIQEGEAWHFSKARPEQVTLAKLTGGETDSPNARIRLTAPSGWQLDPSKFIRDILVLDWQALEAADFGKYLYFFHGEPGWFRRGMNVQKAPLAIRIRGRDFLAAVPPNRLFFRSLDRTIAVRGDYEGPAILSPSH